MQLRKISLAESRSFSPFFIDYIVQNKSLQPFYHRFPKIENFKGQIEDKQKSFSKENRNVLVSTLRQQYEGVEKNENVKRNIEALSDQKTFTVTTGHQLNIFTGPLYFIYKIVTVINTCRRLQEQYPDYRFVPVYWMASEDHDYDEIKYFRLLGKKYVWETNQHGAVGRYHTKGLSELSDQLPGDVSIFKNAYKEKTLSAAVRSYVNTLFANEGVVVIDADDAKLKSLFKEVIYDDVINCSTEKLVSKTNASLEALHYKTQIFCRDINFFYLDGSIRNRIEKSGDRYKVVDTNLSFSQEEMKEMIRTNPEKFSPNVILRPLYQEFILPNVAYVGGPAEVIYWLQLKSVFDHYNIPFPMLMPRNFAMLLEGHIAKKFEKTGLKLETLFEDKNFIFNDWILKNTKHNLTVGSERSTIQSIFKDLEKRAEGIDKTLGPFVAAEGKRTMNSLEKIEKKLLRAEKRFQSDKLRQIEAVKDALFPNGGLQERTDNFLNFYQQDPDFITNLIANFDPFDFRFNILSYNS
jgi:bacillithiol biosynthesis cysteine-adding enzyme BshC